MKKTVVTLFAALLMVVMNACNDPEPEPLPMPPGDDTEQTDPTDPTDDEVESPLSFFIGDYDLDVAVLADDGEVGGSAEHYVGTLQVLWPEGVENPQYVKVNGYFSLAGSGTPVLIYDTYGTLNSDGTLQLESNIYQAAVPLTVSYGPIDKAQPLVWTSQLSGSISGYDVQYNIVNTATKK